LNRLFINLYLDEDVSALIATLVRSRGLSATTTLETGQIGKSDAEQLAFAAERRLAILTHNRADFEKLAAEYYAQGRSHAGIIIAVRRNPYDLTRRLLQLLNDVTADEMDNQVRYI
jgi:predicted nuclease of predicted toxin-antitoxin system